MYLSDIVWPKIHPIVLHYERSKMFPASTFGQTAFTHTSLKLALDVADQQMNHSSMNSQYLRFTK